VHGALRAASLTLGAVVLCGTAAGQDAEGPPAEWSWSVFVDDVLDDGRTFGVRRRVVKGGAIFLGGSYERERRSFDGPDATRTRWGVTGGYRHLLGGGRLKGLLQLEARYSLDRIEADSPLSGDRAAEGAGLFTGFEYFFSRWLSLGARVGVDVERRDEAGGGETRRLGLLRPRIVLSGYW
jgi:hypothetical protein